MQIEVLNQNKTEDDQKNPAELHNAHLHIPG